MAAAVWCVGSLERILADLHLTEDGRVFSARSLDTILNQLEIVYRELSALDAVGELHSHPALMLTGQAIDEVQHLQEQTSTAVSATVYSTPLVCSATVGRPQYLIPRSILVSLVDTGFSVPQISRILSVSIRTVRRRMTEFGLSIRATYSTMTCQELDRVVYSIQQEFPLCGYRQMMGHLRAQGIRMQQSRVRESQRRVDPGGCMMRRLTTIHRRTYRVKYCHTHPLPSRLTQLYIDITCTRVYKQENSKLKQDYKKNHSVNGFSTNNLRG